MAISIKDVRQEATRMLQDIIRIDTSNPPGNELKAVRFIAGIAEDNGIDYEINETAEGRGNIILKLKGTVPGPPLILLSHLDVVGANSVNWTDDPFGGTVRDGYIWGRGTVDTKQLTVMQLMALLSLKRAGITPKRDIYLIATADEESGSIYGLKALLKHKGDLFRNAEVISEGGGFPIKVADKIYYLCETGQKGCCGVKFIFKKNPGANPYYQDNSNIANCSRLIKRLYEYEWKGDVPATTEFLVEKLGLESGVDCSGTLEDKLEGIRDKVSPFFMNIMKAMTQSTIAVTMWKGGKRSIATQYESEVHADLRLLPGVTREEVEESIGKLVGDIPVEWEILNFSDGYDSDCQGGLFSEFNRSIQKRLPECEVVPFIATGASDGRLLREFNARVYGFSPVLAEDMTFETAVSMVHGVNERLSVESLVFGIDILETTLLSYFCGGD